MNLNGRILFEGLSPINGKPIVIIATGFKENSANPKTGFMLQTWILSAELKPNEAFKTNENGYGESVCGDCPHALYNSPKKNGFAPCYVRTYHAPRSVYECYKKGNYPHIENDWHLFNNLPVRLGSFGDPCCIPVEILKNIISRCSKHTGYTHQWRKPYGQHLKGICMASADGMRDYIESTSQGWTPFLVRKSTDEAPKGALICPASAEAGRKVTCADCTSCDGVSRPKGVVIIAH